MVDMQNKGPFTQAADELHAMKYRGHGENFREYANRCAFALADNGAHYQELRPILMQQRFLPGGRIQGAAGATRCTTMYNCFVSGPIEDTYVEGVGTQAFFDQGGIMARASEAAATMRMGGGIGYDFSTLRPRGRPVLKLESEATGPVSFMQIFNAVGLATASSGHRRGAQMGVMRVDHPDVEEFIRVKQNATELKGFNISVGITDEFMEAVLNHKSFALRWGNNESKEIDAAELWEKIMRSTWDWADPGVFFLDTVNRMNNLWYCETISSSNPCGEQPLPPYGACLLGSFNLVRYLKQDAEGKWYFDYRQFEYDVPLVVRAMDNVVDRSLYPLPQQETEAKNKRRMGLGVTGLANAGEACVGPYGSAAFLEFESKVLETLLHASYRASVQLAKEKGPFPLFDADKYLQGQFILGMPDDIRGGISVHGIRNSHLTSIAPTGTISMCADNVSSAVEPTFARSTQRPVNTVEGIVMRNVDDFGAGFLGVDPKVTADVTAAEHVAVLCAAQRHVDSAVSKTCNVTGKMPWADFKGIYRTVWENGGKGCTTFNQDGQRDALLTDGSACEIGPDGRRDCN